MQGQELVGLRYEPLFPYFAHLANAFRVVADGYVTDDSGTGVVHQASAGTRAGWVRRAAAAFARGTGPLPQGSYC